MSRIEPLSADAVANITSSKQITTLQSVAIGLAENSLDAGATKIDIVVDFLRGDCTVEDNGAGILPAEFSERGGLGKMYHTSKRSIDYGPELHGTNGMFLASLAAMSLLKVTSRSESAQEEACLVVHHGKIISRNAVSQTAYAISSPSGTAVAVRNLFGNMPVRVKQRASFAGNSVEKDQVWMDLKLGVTALLLAWPKPCAVRLHDAQDMTRATTLAGSVSDISRTLTERNLNRLSGISGQVDFRDALPTLIQAGIAPAKSRHRWVDVSASTSMISVRGAICLDPSPTKKCQFISIGVRSCNDRDGHHALYNAVNAVFAQSSFGVVHSAISVDDFEKAAQLQDQRHTADKYTQKELQGRKGVDRWPMFVLQLKLSGSQRSVVEDSLLSEATTRSLVEILEATATQWLAAHHMRPHETRRRKNTVQQHPSEFLSSPARTMSAPNPLEYLGQNTRPITPGVNRATTTGNTPGSKRRRRAALTDSVACARSNAAGRGSSSYFDGLSRIKTGNRDICPRAKKVSPEHATLAALNAADAESVADRSRQHPFKLPAIDMGELGSLRSRTLSEHGQGVFESQDGSIDDGGSPLTHSDDYGSVDDEALLAVGDIAVQQHFCGVLGQAASDHAVENIMQWVDPVTEQAYNINARTGVVLPQNAPALTNPQMLCHPSDSVRHPAAINKTLSATGRPLSLARRALIKAGEPQGEWLPGFLKEWENPVYTRRQEQPIPVVSLHGPGLESDSDKHHPCIGHSATQLFDENISGTMSKLSRQAVEQAAVISQVDCKFILCLMPVADGKDKRTLVLVDQHAASERIILERLLTRLCQPAPSSSATATFTSALGHHSAIQTSVLDTPARFEISQQESELFVRYARHFADWGILYDLGTYTAAMSASHVKAASICYRLIVRALPPGISERCTALPYLLIELLRSEIWRLAQSSTRPRSAVLSATAPEALSRLNDDKAREETLWLRRLGSCPRGILDMLNSRACRSAIMFNDILTKTQCEELIADLSRCVFPFMCAHGRVSMAPLLELSGSANGENEGGLEGLVAGTGFERLIIDSEESTFSSAFQRWREGR